MKQYINILVAVIFIQLCDGQSDPIDYFGQTPPGDTAVVFAPNIISIPGRLEGRITFSPDGNECYYQAYTSGFLSKIYYCEQANNTWTEPAEASFSVNKTVESPFMSTDGNRLYFTRKDGTNNDIYKVERISGGWGEPQLLPEPVNSDFDENSYMETSDGQVYIDSKRPDGNDFNIWYIRNSSSQAEELGSAVNSADWDNSPCIAPDGSYLIFGSERNGREGQARLYISFAKENGEWTDAIDMNSRGAVINDNNAHQSAPSLSPDGKYLFFIRHREITDMDIYWVSTNIIDELKEEVLLNQSITYKEATKKLSVFPNPTTGTCTLSFGSTLICESHVEVYNLQGNLLLSETCQDATNLVIDLAPFPADIYTVKVMIDGKLYNVKIIRE